MVHDDELHLVDVEDLPQLTRDLELVCSVARLQSVSRNLHEALRRGRRRVRRPALSHETHGHAQCALPHEIGQKLEALSIPRVQEGARAFQNLLLDHRLIRVGIEQVLRDSVGPANTDHVGSAVLAQTDMDLGTRNHSGLVQAARAHLDLRADPEVVVLAAARR